MANDANIYIMGRNKSNPRSLSCSKRYSQKSSFKNSQRRQSEDSTHKMFPDDNPNSTFYINSVSRRSKSSQRPLGHDNSDSQLTPTTFNESNLVQNFRPSKDTVRYHQRNHMDPENLFRESENPTLNENVYVTAAFPKSPEKSQNTEKISLNHSSQNFISKGIESQTSKRSLVPNQESQHSRLRVNEDNKKLQLLMSVSPEFSQSEEHSSFMFQNNQYSQKSKLPIDLDSKYQSIEQNIIFPNNSQQIQGTNSFNIKLKNSQNKKYLKIKNPNVNFDNDETTYRQGGNMIYKNVSKTNEINASLHVQRYSRQQPIQIDLKQRREYEQTLKTVKSHSKLKDAIIKDNKMKFRSKAQSVNRIKGKLKIPPKLPIFKKKIKTSLARNTRHGSYAQINQGKHKQSLHSYTTRPLKNDNSIKLLSNRNYFPLRERSNTQPNISNNINKLSQTMSNKHITRVNERFHTESLHHSARQNSQLKNSLKYKINKNMQRISEPAMTFQNNKIQYSQNRDIEDHHMKLHTNFMKNVKNVKSRSSLTNEDNNDNSFVKVVRVSVNGKDIPFDHIKRNEKLHSELKIHGYTSFEDNGKRGFRRRSNSRSVNNSQVSSMTPRK
jgi:hypothetical protein